MRGFNPDTYTLEKLRFAGPACAPWIRRRRGELVGTAAAAYQQSRTLLRGTIWSSWSAGTGSTVIRARRKHLTHLDPHFKSVPLPLSSRCGATARDFCIVFSADHRWDTTTVVRDDIPGKKHTCGPFAYVTIWCNSLTARLPLVQSNRSTCFRLRCRVLHSSLTLALTPGCCLLRPAFLCFVDCIRRPQYLRQALEPFPAAPAW
jgi:hypothetical protein